MLFRKPFGMSRVGDSRSSKPDDAEDEVAPRSLPKTPIYEASPSRYWEDPEKSDVQVSYGRRLSRLLGDRCFHPLSEILAAGLDRAECLAAIAELLPLGHAFDRSDDCIRMRMRLPIERSQSVSDFMSFINVTYDSEVFQEEVDAPTEFNPSDDAAIRRQSSATTPGTNVELGGLVLSDPPASLTLPVEGACSRTVAILAQRGAGKTYLGGVMVEEMCEHLDGGMFVVFDPNGVWWGLLSQASGRVGEHPILLLGGPRGHLPVGARDGAKAADIVFAIKPCPVVVDLSKLAPVEQHQLVADFCERIVALPHFPLHLVIDEADEFVPQRLREPARHQKRALANVERIVMRGRARGIGATLISLRPAVVNKNVLSQVDSLFLLRMAEPNDLRAVRDWLGNFEHGITDEQRSQCLSQLPILPVGISYYLRGGDEMMFRRFKVRRKRTYDSSKTLVAGAVDDPTLVVPSSDVMAKAQKILGAP